MKKLCIVALMMAALTTSARAQDPEAGETALEPAAPPPAEPSAKPSEEASAPAVAAPTASPTVVAQSEEPAEPAEKANEAEAPYDTRYPNKRYIDAVLERSSHASLGYALGRQGDGFVFGPRFDLPITKTNWMYLQFFHYTNFGPFRGDFDPVLMFGVNFISRTKLIMGMFRLYGGGGFHVGFRPSPACKNPLDQTDIARAYVYEGQPVSLAEPVMPSTPAQIAVAERISDIRERCEEQKDPFGISGGGTGGIEFFSSPMRAYFIEISGGGGTQKNNIWSDSGLILRAGNQFYF